MKLKLRRFSLNLLLIFDMLCMFSACAAPKRRLEGTPETGTSHVVVDLTPGQEITQKMTSFSVQKLREVMPADLFAKLEERTACYGGLAILSDPNIEYENRNKWYVFRKVKDLIADFKEKPDNLDSFYNSVLRLFQDAERTALHRIHFKTTEFFQALHSDGRITIDDKCDGVQLGCVAIVTEPCDKNVTSESGVSGKTFKYYVKTHSHGLLQDKTASAKQFNVIELLMYKILETTGIGCKCYFFARNELDLYIATLDASHDGEFVLYNRIKEKFPKTDAECKAFILQDEESKIIAYEITKLDLLCRILRLSDLQTNSSNFGFVKLPDGTKKARAIDFRTIQLSEDIQVEDFALTENSFKALMNGNGSYIYKDSFMCAVLAPDSPIGKISTLQKVFGEFSLLENMINEARLNVFTCLPELIPDNDEIIRKMTQQLNQITEILNENHRLFKRLFSERLKIAQNN